MKKALALARGDLKNTTRDPMLWLCLGGPLFLAAALGLIRPWLESLSAGVPGFVLADHYRITASFMLMFTPMMVGAMAGLLLLDERDENMLQYYAVTPLSKAGYLAYRLAAPALLSFLFSFPVLALTGLVRLEWGSLIPVTLMAALQAPLVTLLMGAFAGNKIEGLTLTKGLGLLFLGPVAGYLLPWPWHLFGGVMPPYWVSQAFLTSEAPGAGYWLYLAGGFAVHLAALAALLRRFNRRAG